MPTNISSSPGELFETAAGLPLPKFEPPLERSMPPLSTELPAGQRSGLEAAVLERTKQLNRLFEDQVKKQYEAMRREVTKLAKAHQKDVQALDTRFKSKMAGLASRFKQLEEEEAKVQMIQQYACLWGLPTRPKATALCSDSSGAPSRVCVCGITSTGRMTICRRRLQS